MTFSENPARGNKSGYLYTQGSESEDGSIRLSINPFTGIARIEERENGIWGPASFETDSASVWVGPRVGIGGAGCNLITEDSDGSFNLFAHSAFNGELSTSDAKIINAYEFIVRDIVIGDDSGEWSGQVYAYNYQSPDHRMLRKAYYRTGAIAATSPVRLQVWEGFDDTGPVVFDRTYPANIFIANSEIQVTAEGFVEFEKDKNYYVNMSSDNNFSLKTTSDLVFPWTAGDISLVRSDDMLQAIPYVDGDTFTKGQWAIQNKKVYECNVTGAQTGTFEDNSDKWNVLGSASVGDMAKSVYDTGENGIVDNSEKLEGNDSAYHLDRTNHSGTQLSSTISDFDTEVANNLTVSANTAKNSYPSADQTKLSGIEALAEVNQSDIEIKTQYENNSNTNAFTDAEKSKVSSLESSKFLGEYVSLSALETAHPSPAIGSYANVDLGAGQDVVRYVWDNDDSQYVLQLGESTILTDAQIKTQYEANPDTNAFTDSEKSNLSNQSGSNSGDVTLESGSTTQESLVLTGQEVKANLVTQTTDGVMSKQDKIELDNISANGGGDGWISGLATSEDSPKGTTILYGAGTYLINGMEKAIASSGSYDLANGFGSVDHYSGMTDDQHALVSIYVDNAEVIKSLRGDVGEKGDTIFPPLQPPDSVYVSFVEIKAGSGGTPKDIDHKHIFDSRTSPSINTDETVSASVDDQSTGYLIDKISTNGNVVATIENPGADEKIKLDAPGEGSSSVPRITAIRNADHSISTSESYIPYESTLKNNGFTLTAEGWITATEDGFYFGGISYYCQEASDPIVSVWLEKKPLATGVWELCQGSMVNIKYKESGGTSMTLNGGIDLLIGDILRVKAKTSAGTSTLITQSNSVALGTIYQYASSVTIYKIGPVTT